MCNYLAADRAHKETVQATKKASIILEKARIEEEKHNIAIALEQSLETIVADNTELDQDDDVGSYSSLDEDCLSEFDSCSSESFDDDDDDNDDDDNQHGLWSDC